MSQKLTPLGAFPPLKEPLLLGFTALGDSDWPRLGGDLALCTGATARLIGRTHPTGTAFGTEASFL